MLKFPEKYRKNMQGLPFIPGGNGVFVVPAGKRCYACIIASNGLGWEHVSVHMVEDERDRTPTWEEMCVVKALFWEPEDCIVQYHPPPIQLYQPPSAYPSSLAADRPNYSATR